jgi:hypothetical protein
MGTENERLAREGYEALMRGEIEVIGQMMVPDLTWLGWERGAGDPGVVPDELFGNLLTLLVAQKP